MGKEINKVIAQLSSIETASSKVVESADKEKSDYASLMEKKTQEFDAQLAKDSEALLTKTKETLRQSSIQEFESWKESARQELERIDQAFSLHHEEMAKKIFDQIISK